MDTKLRCFWSWRTKMERRKFSREFKIEAVKLVREREVKVAQAARDMDVHATVLRSWVREFAGVRVRPFPAMAR
jgi:transposase